MSILDDFNEWLERFEFNSGRVFCEEFKSGIARYIDRNGEVLVASKSYLGNPFKSMLKDYCYIVAKDIDKSLHISKWDGDVIMVYDTTQQNEKWFCVGNHTYIRCR
jgi:hypothetical protein